jgi:GDPmannose 4,6-dehydratase
VIATGRTHSIRDLLERAFGHVELNWQDFVTVDERYFRPTEVDALRGDASKAREKLGWVPEITFEEMVAEMVDHELKRIDQAN